MSVSQIINENAFSSAYFFDSMNMWHARLAHASVPYIKKVHCLGLISDLTDSCLDICEICAESKLIKKYVYPDIKKQNF